MIVLFLRFALKADVSLVFPIFSSRLEIPHSDHFASQDFCLTMWLYLLDDYNGQWRTLVHKGARDHERTPTLFLEPQTRGVEFFVSTSDTSQVSRLSCTYNGM